VIDGRVFEGNGRFSKTDRKVFEIDGRVFEEVFNISWDRHPACPS
jgi:hypothetical protein